MTVNIEGLGRITASKDVLNYISIAMSEASYHFELKGLSALQKEAKEYANAIYNELDSKGYYE